MRNDPSPIWLPEFRYGISLCSSFPDSRGPPSTGDGARLLRTCGNQASMYAKAKIFQVLRVTEVARMDAGHVSDHESPLHDGTHKHGFPSLGSAFPLYTGRSRGVGSSYNCDR